MNRMGVGLLANHLVKCSGNLPRLAQSSIRASFRHIANTD
jgi:hypothetical protein